MALTFKTKISSLQSMRIRVRKWGVNECIEGVNEKCMTGSINFNDINFLRDNLA